MADDSNRRGSSQPQRDPLPVVAPHRFDRVHELVEHAHEGWVGSAPVLERPHPNRDVVLSRLDLDREATVTVTGIQRAQERELQVVHSLVREVEPAADPTEYECRDASETRCGGDREEDRVGHRLRVRPGGWPRLVAVARAGDLEVTRDELPNGCAVVRVLGEADMAGAQTLEDTLRGVEPATRLVVDLSACTFIDSSAVRVLVTTARRMQGDGGVIALVAQEAGILRVLEIAAVDTVLSVYPTLESALD